MWFSGAAPFHGLYATVTCQHILTKRLKILFFFNRQTEKDLRASAELQLNNPIQKTQEKSVVNVHWEHFTKFNSAIKSVFSHSRINIVPIIVLYYRSYAVYHRRSPK